MGTGLTAAQAGLELVMLPRMDLNSRLPCFHLPSGCRYFPTISGYAVLGFKPNFLRASLDLS